MQSNGVVQSYDSQNKNQRKNETNGNTQLMEYQALSTIEMDVIILINCNILFFGYFFSFSFFSCIELVSVFVFWTQMAIFSNEKKSRSIGLCVLSLDRCSIYDATALLILAH